MSGSHTRWFTVNSMQRTHKTRLRPPHYAPPATSLRCSLLTRFALALAFLVGATAAVASDAPTAIVPAEGIDAMSWLCVLNTGDSPDAGSLRQSAPAEAAYQAPSSFRSLGTRAGLGPAVTANRTWTPAMVDPGTSIGVGLCHASFESGAALPSPVPSDFDSETIVDISTANADMLVSAGLSLAGYVVIPDAGLRRAVEQAIGKREDEPITPLDMAGLTSLAARRAGITDLSGLEFAVRLKQLDLNLNAVSDLAPLAGLTSLEMLSLARNRIGDDALSTVSRLTGLEVLSLAGNGLDDLSPLSDLPRLRVLDIARTTTGDLWPLQGLTQLEGLYLGDNAIEDISALSGLSRLKWLLLGGNGIGDISPLSSLTALEALGLRSNAVGDLTPLVGLTELETLDLENNAIDDISALSGLIELAELNLWGNAISDVSSLAGLSDLKVLYLGDNAIEDISALAGLTALRTLRAPSNALYEVSALAGLTELEVLHLGRNAIADVSLLAGLTGLRELSLGGNAIEDISPLAGLIGLEELDLWRNGISDVSPLAGLDDLQILRIGENEIEDLSVLAGRSELVELGLQENAIEDISVLAGLTGLEVLLLGDNMIEDISVVAGLTKLVELDLSRLGVTDGDLQILAGLTELRVLDLGLNNITDISLLADLRELNELYLQGNSIEDISPLAELRRLAWLDLRGNAITDVSPLAGLWGLFVLDLSHNAVEDILPLVLNEGLGHGDIVALSGNPLGPASRDQLIPDLRARGVEVVFDGDTSAPVSIPDDGLRSAIESALGKDDGDPITAADMAELTELVVESAGIEDLTGLEYAVNLIRLELDNNNVMDLSPLAELRDLQWLSLLYNSIEDLSPLARLTALEVLDLGSNFVEDISPLSGLTVLKGLSLWRNAVRDLSPLAGLTALQVLDVGSNAVNDISPLSELAALEVLSIRDNAVDDLSPLARLTSLKTLYLEANVIVNISPLAGLTNIASLYLGNNSVEDVSPLVDNEGLDDGDFVSLTGNPLSGESTGVHIPALEARGVEVEFDAGVTFAAQRDITTDADWARSVYAADLDGDGDPDVLSASRDDDKVAWYENLGGGSFSAQRVITTDADGASSVHAADLDGDGDADVLSTSAFDSKVAWYENLGGGSFSEQRLIATGPSPSAVHAADLDGDGDADILPTSASDAIAWYENLGDGAFSTRHVIAIGAEGVVTTSVRAADLDGDGDADVLWGSNVDDAIRWHENLGGGSFSAERVIVALAPNDSLESMSVRAADLDGDGDADVLSASSNGGIVWAENLGGGSFSTGRVIDNAGGVSEVHAADLDGDGDSDILSARAFQDEIVWYDNLGRGAFSGGRVITTDADYIISVHAADLDGDGDAEVLSALRDDDTIAWFENQSDHGDDHDNSIGAAATFATSLPAYLHGTLELPGDRDVFRFVTGTGTLRVYSNGLTDTFGSLINANGVVLAENDDREDDENLNFRIEVEVNAGTHYIEVRGYDGETTGPYTLSIEFEAQRAPFFDSDGPPDQSYTTGTAIVELTLPTASGGSGALDYSLTPIVPGLSFDPATRRLFGTPTAAGDYHMTYSATDANGDGVSWTFTISVTAPSDGLFSAERVISTEADFANSVHAVDLDGDGDPDVLTTSQFDHKVAWYENLGDGEFSAQRVISTDHDHPHSIHAADIDGDGDADVLAASWRDTKVAWYSNLGGGQFSTQRVITSEFRALSVHAADLDGDGDADVVSSSDDAGIEWYENRDGAFTAHRIENEATDAVHAADIDNDGDADILSASRSSDKIAWYENLGGGSFSGQRVLDGVSYASAVRAADLDGDGDADVLAAFGWGQQDDTDDEIAWYENLGGGLFAARRTITTDVENPEAVAAADLDGDGDQDVLSASFFDSKFAWYENLGNGSFSVQRVIDTGGYPTDVLPVDLDGDGDPDFLATSGYDDEVAWYESQANHGDDHGDAPASATLVTVLPAFLHGTLESGGDRDVFRAATGNGTLRVYSNGPTDTYGTLLDADGGELAADDDNGASTNFMIDVEVAPGVHHIEVRGFNSAITGPYTLSIVFEADRHPSLVAGGPGNQSYTTGTAISALTLPAGSGGNGELTYSLTPLVPGLSFDPVTRRLTGTPTAAGDYAMTYSVTDADGDRVVWTFTISVAAAPGGASFSAQRVITTDADLPRSIFSADLDGDGDPDVLSASSGDDKIAWYENLGGGAFSAQRIITTDADSSAHSAYAADLDGDGDADVLSAGGTIADRINRVAWYENLGGGAFSGQRVIAAYVDEPRSVRAADMDGDGDADVLSASLGKITWYENLGGGEFPPERIDELERVIEAGVVITTDVDGARSVHAADLDGDGDPDVLSASSGDDKIAWYENLGGGEFSAQRVITTDADGAETVHAADLDGDGDADVLYAAWGTGVGNNAKVAWQENLGGGAFSAQRVITDDVQGVTWVHAADLDGDSDIDVFYPAFNASKVGWNENLGNGTFAAQRILAQSPEILNPNVVHAADVDGDGDMDMLYSLLNDQTIAWHENLSNHGDDYPGGSAARLVTALPAFRHGVLETENDFDTFRVATGRGTLRVYSNGPTDTRGSVVRGTDGLILARDDDSGAGLNFLIEVSVEPGFYEIPIRGFGTGPYTLSIEFSSDASSSAGLGITP